MCYGPDFSRPELAPFRAGWIASEFDNSPENMGRKGSYISYGQHWAQVSAAPLRLFKATMAEGGTRVPAIINWQGTIAGGGQAPAFASVMDILPTLTELARGEAARIEGSHGRSLAPLFSDPGVSVHPGTDIFAGEMLASRAIVQGDYKLLYLPEPLGSGDWALYDLSSDPLEQADLSRALPEKRAQMLEFWEAYERDTGIVPSPDGVTGPLLAVQ
ncbi:arylsulfatase [Hyphomonas polymorpha PS728]|uniref:Arylsulfatase n=1 Tax=Hyphomonas polymorpha PS728 TaxID=1280954 RepID=A0A062VFY0_9PROT|nr:sulfatase-like hydrolase/transferase [Hyphomonas polymorpha]KCZ96930.1 arylsulfatase [Hyphomonas polymorpha PS728]